MSWAWWALGAFLAGLVMALALCKAAKRGDDCRRWCEDAKDCPGDWWCERGGGL